jgi:hypothetical protein
MSTPTLYVLSRAPNDSFTYDIYNNLLSTLTCDFEAYYIWSDPPAILRRFLNHKVFTKPNVVIGIKDMLDMWLDHNFWRGDPSAGVALLDKMAQRYPDKNFIIFTSLENINLESIQATNIQYVQWGGDIVNQADIYQYIMPVLDKNFDSTKPFISLNRNRRQHRVATLSYLFGKGYEEYGQITYLGQYIDASISDLLDYLPWRFDEHHAEARQAMLVGYPKFYNNKSLAVEEYGIYEEVNDNVTNFNQNLRERYENSFVEIVSESSFSAPSYMITEKWLNSVYGCNFPILLGGCGAIAHLREIGFDLFDDIIDHSYDQIANPFDRIFSAIDTNHRLLTDVNYVKQLWKDNMHRFEKNIDVAKNVMYKWYHNRAGQQFNQLTWIN